MTQFVLFSEAPARKSAPTAERARERLEAALADLAAADAMPWTLAELSYWQTIFPQMSRWLPVEDRKRLCAEFSRHIARLHAKAA